MKKKCDFLVTIPMVSKFDSFNVAVAAGIIQYAILIHRMKKTSDVEDKDRTGIIFVDAFYG